MATFLAELRHTDEAILTDAIRRVLTRKIVAALDTAGYKPCTSKGGKLLTAGYRTRPPSLGRRAPGNASGAVMVDVGIPPIHERHWPESRIGTETEGYLAALTGAGLDAAVDEKAWMIHVTGPITDDEITAEDTAIRHEHEVDAIKGARYNVIQAMQHVALPDVFTKRLEQLRHDMSTHIGQET